MKTYRLLREELMGSAPTPEMFDGGKQIDWIIYDKEMTSLFCIAIVNSGSGWYLWEVVNLFDHPVEMIRKCMSLGYHTMFMAQKGREDYKYIIGEGKSSKTNIIINRPFWETLIPGNPTFKTSTMKPGAVPVNISEFVKEMDDLAWEMNHTGKK